MIRSLTRQAVGWLASPRLARLVGEPCFRLFGMPRDGGEIDPGCLKRVLVVRLDEIGDVIMTTPFLRELRRLLPDAWITLVVKPAVHNLVERCPYVNEVLTYDWRGSRYVQPLQRRWRALALAYRHFWHRQFDVAILPRWDADYYDATFVTYLSGARWRVGYSENVIEHKRRLNGGFDRLFTDVLDDRTGKHEVQRGLDLIRFIGGAVQDDRLELWLGEGDEAFVERTLKSHAVHPDDLLIAFGPGAGAPKRMWPLPNFLELGNWLGKEFQARIVVVGGHGEGPLGNELQRRLGETVINVVGQTTLRQTGALLARCELFVGNDAGPAHLAAAGRVPVVEISCHAKDGSHLHYNSPTRFGPWGVPHRVLQPETGLELCSGACTAPRAHCILSVGVQRVKEAIVALLSRQGNSLVLERVVEH